MTLVTNRDSEDSRPRECWRPLVGMSTVEVIPTTCKECSALSLQKESHVYLYDMAITITASSGRDDTLQEEEVAVPAILIPGVVTP